MGEINYISLSGWNLHLINYEKLCLRYLQCPPQIQDTNQERCVNLLVCNLRLHTLHHFLWQSGFRIFQHFAHVSILYVVYGEVRLITRLREIIDINLNLFVRSIYCTFFNVE